jgi:hypothetical protein
MGQKKTYRSSKAEEETIKRRIWTNPREGMEPWRISTSEQREP